jgi:hypothetical protein
LNGIESGATADQSAAQILAAVKTVDGSGSGLDADSLDGQHASSFATLSGSNSFSNPLSAPSIVRSNGRVSSGAEYPLGHYTSGEEVFSIDPTWTDAELKKFFNNTGVSWASDSTAPAGYTIEINGGTSVGGAYGSGFPLIPVGTTDEFYIECWVKDDGAVGHYMGSNEYNENFGSLGGNPGSYGYSVMSNTQVGSTWTKQSAYIGGFHASNVGDFEVGTKYFTPLALFNYSHSGGTRRCWISGWKITKVSHEGNRNFTGNLNVGGSITASGDITAYSDDSLKTNVQVIDGALGRVEAIRGVTFDRITDGSSSTGVIAQELLAVLPEAVHTDAQGIHSVAYGNITGLLIEAVKELSAQVAELKSK